MPPRQAALRVRYAPTQAGECLICQVHFQAEEVATISCGHKLHPLCMAYLARESEAIIACPSRCGNLRRSDVRVDVENMTAPAGLDQWQGEVNRDEIDTLREARDENTLDAAALARLHIIEAPLVAREA